MLDFFDADKRKQRSVRKAGEKLASNLSTPEGRQGAVDLLSGLGTDEAIRMLLMRFKMRISSEIADRDEKEDVLRIIVGFGERSLQPIREHLKREDEIHFPLQAMAKLAPQEECVEIALALLAEIGVPHPRQRPKVLQLLQFLLDYKDDRILDLALPLLREETADDVRVAAAILIGRQTENEAHRNCLLEALVGEQESVRLRLSILDILTENGWGVQGYRKQVEELLPAGYSLEKSGKLKKRAETR